MDAKKKKHVFLESALSEKEKLLLQSVKATFATLGPDSMALMKEIVSKDATQKARSNEKTPTLREVERFFKRLSVEEELVAYWRIRPAKKGLLIDPEISKNDLTFQNEYHVFPVHVFASQKRMTCMWQKKYVDAFGRRVPAFGWPFESTICQAVCFGWLIGEGILERLRTVNLLYPKRVIKKEKTGKPNDIFLFEYPKYIATPPLTGCSPSNPETMLELVLSSPKVVYQYYLKVAKSILWIDEKKQKDDGLEMISLSHLPLLENKTKPTENKMSESKTADLFGKMLFSMPQTKMEASSNSHWSVFEDSLPKFLMDGETDLLEKETKELFPNHNKMASALDALDESDVLEQQIMED